MSNAPPTQSQAPDHQHRAKERQYWTWQTFIGICAVVISVLAVGITAAGFYVLLQTLSATRDAVAEAHRQAKAAEEQTIIAKDALVASNRPWIEFDEAKAVTLTVAHDYISTEIDFAYRNVGHSPAEVVAVHTSLVMRDEFGDLARTVCEEERSRPNGMTVEVVFPDKPGSTRVGVSIMMRDVIADRQERLRDYNERRKEAPPGWFALNEVDGSTVALWISGCIAYKFYGSNDIHATGFSLSVKVRDHSDATGSRLRLIDTEHRRTFKDSEIVLERAFGGSFAD